MSIKREKIREQVDSISFSDLCGRFDEVINVLELKKYHLKSICPDFDKIWIEDCSDEFTGELGIFIERLENDKEYNARVKKLMKIKANEATEKQRKEEREYQQYLKLRKKYQHE